MKISVKETRRTLSKPMKRLQNGYSYSIILAIEFSPNECDENLLNGNRISTVIDPQTF